MKIEDVIFMLNKHIQLERNRQNLSTRGHLVLLKTIIPHKTMRVYKEVEVCLWYVNGRTKVRVLTEHLTSRILEGQEENILNDLYNDLTLKIFNWMKSKDYDKVVKGEYGKVEAS